MGPEAAGAALVGALRRADPQHAVHRAAVLRVLRPAEPRACKLSPEMASVHRDGAQPRRLRGRDRRAPASRPRRAGRSRRRAAWRSTSAQVFTRVVLPPALARVWPAMVSQIIIVMLGSAVCGQIATQELSYYANLIQSRNFRAFEAFIVATLIYLALRSRCARPAELGRAALSCFGRVSPAAALMDSTPWSSSRSGTSLRNLLLAARWTVVLSLIAFVGGGLVGLALLLARLAGSRGAERAGRRLRAAVPGHAAADAAVPRLLRPRAARPQRLAVVRRRRWRSRSTPAPSWPRSGAAASTRSRKGQWEAADSLALSFGETDAPRDRPAGAAHRGARRRWAFWCR